MLVNTNLLLLNKMYRLKHDIACFSIANMCVDIEHKIACLRCSWVKRKLSWIENYSFAKYNFFGENFKVHSNLNIPQNTLSYFPSFYKDILKLWTKYYSNQPSLPSTIISQYLWFNSFIKIDNNVVFHRKFSEKKPR